MARCLYRRSIKSPVPHIVFRPPVGGRWSVYEVNRAGVAQAWGYRRAPGHGYPWGYQVPGTTKPQGPGVHPWGRRAIWGAF